MDAHCPHRSGGDARFGCPPRRHSHSRLDDERPGREIHPRTDQRGHRATWGSEGWRDGVAGDLGGAVLPARRGQVRGGIARPAPQDRGNRDDSRPIRSLNGRLARLSGCTAGTPGTARSTGSRRTDRPSGTAGRTARSRRTTCARSTARATGRASRATGIRRTTCATGRATGSGRTARIPACTGCAAGRPTRTGHIAAALSGKDV